jgi:hypothetical protein
MKKLLLPTTLLTLLASVSLAQTVAIPATVLQSFTSLYPEVKEVVWNNNDESYEASFKLRNKGVALYFDENGYVNEVKNEIMLFELPGPVINLMARDYPDWRVGKAMHVDVNGTAYYETVVEKEKKSVTLVFDRCGALMMKVIL